MQKNINEMTPEEARRHAKQCIKDTSSEAEIRNKLSAAGFKGTTAAIHHKRVGDVTIPHVVVRGPRDEVIAL